MHPRYIMFSGRLDWQNTHGMRSTIEALVPLVHARSLRESWARIRAWACHDQSLARCAAVDKDIVATKAAIGDAGPVLGARRNCERLLPHVAIVCAQTD